MIFAKVESAIDRPGGEYIMVGSPEYERLYEWTVKTNGMPADFFTPEFYFERKSLVDNRLWELMNIDLRQELERAY